MNSIIKKYVEEYLRELGDDVDLEESDDLVAIGFDSIGYLRLLDFINTQFGIRVPDSDVTVEQFGSVESIAAYLSQHNAPSAAPST